MDGFILADMWSVGEKGTSVEVGDEAVAGKIALGGSAGCLPFALQIFPSPLPILLSTAEAGLYG